MRQSKVIQLYNLNTPTCTLAGYTDKLVNCALEEIDGIVLNKTVNKRKNLAFVLVLDKTSRFCLAD